MARHPFPLGKSKVIQRGGSQMMTRSILMLSLAAGLFANYSLADSLYVSTVSGQFGTLDSATGGYTQIGEGLPDPLGGLVAGPGGLMGVSFSGNLDSINPGTGAVSVIGPTGLGPNALDTVAFGGVLYETDFSNNLYRLNPTTGAATLIGNTGIPVEPPAGDCVEALFVANGKIYVTYEVLDPHNNFAVLISPNLYQIDPASGAATLIGSTGRNLSAAVELNGAVYAFQGDAVTGTSDEVSLDVATGHTSFVTHIDPGVAFVDGATTAPEPSSVVLSGLGIIAFAFVLRRKRPARAEFKS
jgi:hypothetical protein